MNLLEVAGRLCKVLLPIPDDVFYGNPSSSVAICTLSSMNLLREIASSVMMERIALAGRLLSENKGIDALIRHVNKNPNITTIILCGKEVSGHRAGHSLLLVHRHRIDMNGRIINSVSPDPVLTVTESEVAQFQRQINIVDKIGETQPHRILD